MSTQFKLSVETVRNIISSRAMVRQHQENQTVRFHIQGNGNIIPVKDKNGKQVMANGTDNIPLTKTIYGTKVNSYIAMVNPRNRQMLQDAVAAEQAGADEFEVNAAYNAYLNKLQVSFSVINNPGRKQTVFTDKQLVEGEVKLITTDNGQLLTFENVRPVAIEKLNATPSFSLEDLMGLDAEGPKVEDVFTPIDGVPAETDKA